MSKLACFSIALLMAVPGFTGTYFLDFNDGLLPSAHGWTSNVSPGITEQQAWSVSGGILTGNTSSLAGENGAYYSLSNAYDPSLPAVFEIRARHVAGVEELATGFQIVGPQYWTSVGIGSNYVGIAIPSPQNEALVNVGDTSQFRTYRLELAAGNGFQSLFVDGLLVYQNLPRQQSIQAPSVAFGDLGGAVMAGGRSTRSSTPTMSPNPRICSPSRLPVYGSFCT